MRTPASRTPASRTPAGSRRGPADQHAWQRRPSPLSRYALLVYALIVVDASLFPFSGWRDLGLAPYEFLVADWPRRPLPFDLFVNMIGYLPLGFLAALAVHPRLRGVAMVVVATLLCAALSIHLEALQTYLPSRVASKVDVLANVAGGFLGAVLAARVAHALLDTSRLRIWRTRWFAGDASHGLALVAVWFGALVYPDAFVLGTGGLLKAFDPAASGALAATVGLVGSGGPAVTTERFQLADGAVACLAMLGVGLLFLNLQRAGLRWWKRLALLATFAATTIAVAALSRAFLFTDVANWPLLTPGARDGIAVAAVLLLIATAMPARLRWAGGLASIAVSLLLVNVWPDNPYGAPVALAWTRGKLLNFYGLASGLNLVWPYVAIAYLLRHRGRVGDVDRAPPNTAAGAPAPGTPGDRGAPAARLRR